MTDTVDYCKKCYHPKDNHRIDGYSINLDCDVDGCDCDMYVYGETRTTAASGAQKGTKPERYSLVPTYPLALLSRLYAKGAEKYAAHNWRGGYEWSKSYDAAMRHLTAFWEGEDIDPETGVPHPINVVFHMFVLTQYMKDHPELDDRYRAMEKTFGEAFADVVERYNQEGVDLITPEEARHVLGIQVKRDAPQIAGPGYENIISIDEAVEEGKVIRQQHYDDFIKNLEGLADIYEDYWKERANDLRDVADSLRTSPDSFKSLTLQDGLLRPKEENE